VGLRRDRIVDVSDEASLEGDKEGASSSFPHSTTTSLVVLSWPNVRQSIKYILLFAHALYQHPPTLMSLLNSLPDLERRRRTR
jgi:hypothetical protein